jgi:hypothetical protein
MWMYVCMYVCTSLCVCAQGDDRLSNRLDRDTLRAAAAARSCIMP